MGGGGEAVAEEECVRVEEKDPEVRCRDLEELRDDRITPRWYERSVRIELEAL